MAERRTLPARPMPKPTAQVEPYVDAMGAELAVTFLLAFGGAELAIPDAPTGRTAHELLIGPDAAARLCAVKDRLQRRVPLAKAWLAAMLAWQGHSTAHIARTLRVSDTSVRRLLKDSAV
ncbi:MAG: helix-turn-helix domain-containing protein [Paracoccaceae bacterium]